MRKHRDAHCVECGLTPTWHSIKSKSFRKGPKGPEETDEPPHGFQFGGRG